MIEYAIFSECHSVISCLQDELAAKYARVASLEVRIVDMSLKLAGAKSFEDEHRSWRRTPIADPSDNEPD